MFTIESIKGPYQGTSNLELISKCCRDFIKSLQPAFISILKLKKKNGLKGILKRSNILSEIIL